MNLSIEIIIFAMGLAGVLNVMIQQSQKPQAKKVKVRSKYRK
jgi:hypothetical protein